MASRVGQTATFLTAAAICGYGGTWQIKRRHDKKEMIFRRKTRLHQKPTPCPSQINAQRLDDLEYSPVVARGTLDFDNQILVGARTIPYKLSGDQIKTWGGFLYTPLILKDGGKILVNRGWVPHNRRQEANDEKLFKDGTAKFIGIVRKAERATWVMPDVNPAGISWLYLDRDVAIEHFDLQMGEDGEPVILDVIAPQNKDEWPRRITKETLNHIPVPPEQHAAYVFIWYSLMCVALYYAHFRWRQPLPKTVTFENMSTFQKNMQKPIKK